MPSSATGHARWESEVEVTNERLSELWLRLPLHSVLLLRRLTVSVGSEAAREASPPTPQPSLESGRAGAPLRYSPVLPSIVSRMMSACPACLATSSIMCMTTQRALMSEYPG
jgi:hypothetical protein